MKKRTEPIDLDNVIMNEFKIGKVVCKAKPPMNTLKKY